MARKAKKLTTKGLRGMSLFGGAKYGNKRSKAGVAPKRAKSGALLSRAQLLKKPSAAVKNLLNTPLW